MSGAPGDHVAKLEGLLSGITRVITVGWRSTETDFLNLLGSKLTSDFHLMVVSGDENGASETIKNLSLRGKRPIDHYLVGTGFSGLIAGRLNMLEDFLRIASSPQSA